MIKKMLATDTVSTHSSIYINPTHCLGPDAQPHRSPTSTQNQGDAIDAVDNHSAQCRPRKDSGYSEEPRRPIYRFSSDSGVLTFLELERNLDESVTWRSSTIHYGRSRSRRSSSAFSNEHLRHRYSKTPLKENSKPKSTVSQDSQQAVIMSSSNSMVETPKALSRKASVSRQIPARDMYLVHQKSISVIQTLELSENAVSSNESSRSPSLLTNESLTRQSMRSDSSAMTSTADLEGYISSPLYAATNIDWTDPVTRQKAYDKHDRDQRGLRRLLKKLTPRKWQAEQLQFYDGNSDAGSVRRYRLDI